MIPISQQTATTQEVAVTIRTGLIPDIGRLGLSTRQSPQCSLTCLTEAFKFCTTPAIHG